MTDEEYVAELRAILTRLTPVGSGSGARVTSVRIVRDETFDELEIEFEAVVDGVERGPGSLRVDIDRAWRELSGYAEPGTYVQVVVRKLDQAAYRVGKPPPFRTDPAHAWTELLRELSYAYSVREVSHGRLEVTEPDGDVFTMLVTPEQAAQIAGGDIYFHSLLAPRKRDETFIVFHRGDLHRSVREQLPPVSSIEFRLELERARQSVDEAIARDPNARIGWFAVWPDSDS